MKLKFPLSISALKGGEDNKWAIGDALIAECGPPHGEGLGVRDGSRARLQELAKEALGELGLDCGVDALAHIRTTAYLFKSSQRSSGIAFSTHRVAGTPEILDAIIAGAPKGTNITQRYVEGIRRTQAEHARAEREEENAKATAAREKAEAEEAEALKKVRDARDAEEKEAAQVEAKKASRKAEKAAQKERETKVAPKKKISPPTKEEVPQLVAEMSFLGNASRSVVLARASVKDLESCLEQLSPKSLRALRSSALEAANAWQDAATSLQEHFGGSAQGLLSVVGE